MRLRPAAVFKQQALTYEAASLEHILGGSMLFLVLLSALSRVLASSRVCRAPGKVIADTGVAAQCKQLQLASPGSTLLPSLQPRGLY